MAQPTLHARHMCSPAGLQGTGPESPAAGPGTPTSDLRRDSKGASAGTLCWGDKREIGNRVPIFFATGDPPVESSLQNRNGGISTHFLHFSIKLTLGEEGNEGFAVGTEGHGKRGDSGGSEQAAAGLSHGDAPSSAPGSYLSSVHSGMPASSSAARNCVRTPRMLLMKPLESGKSGKPMSG